MVVTQQFFISEWAKGCHNSTIPEPLIILDVRMQQLDPDNYGPYQIPNKVNVASMTPSFHLGSTILQKADDNHTTVLHFGVVQGFHGCVESSRVFRVEY